jgi:hypothetical protein
MQITFKDKARADEKAQPRLRRDEQYILRRSAIRQSTSADNWALARRSYSGESQAKICGYVMLQI